MTSVEEDETGTATIHVWDALINQVKSGTTYEIENLTVKQFQGVTHVGANFFLLFSFSYTYFLSCIIFLCALRYFVNYTPLLRAVCKFGYSLLSRPYFTRVASVYQCNSVRGSRFFFSVSLTTKPCYPQHLVSGFVFIVFFNFVLRWPLRSLSVL